MDFEKKSKEAGWSTNYRSLFKLWLYPTWSHNLPLEIMIGTNLNLPFLKKPKLSRKLQLFLPIDILRRTFKIIPSSYIYDFCSNLTLCRGLTLTPGIMIWTYLNLSYLKMLPTSFCFYTKGFFFLLRRIHVILKNTNNFFYIFFIISLKEIN